MLIDNCDFGFVSGHIDNLNTGCLSHNWYWEGIIDENSCDDTVWQTDDQRLRFWWAGDDFHELDGVLEDPFTDQDTRESQELDLLLKDEDEVVWCHVEISALDTFVDLFVSFVFHVEWIVSLHWVNNDFLGQLNSKSVLVNCDFLDVITASNLDPGLSDKVLDDYIGHQLSVSVSFLVQTVDSVEVDAVGDDVTVVSSREDSLGRLVDRDRPDPVLALTDLAEFDALFIP